MSTLHTQELAPASGAPASQWLLMLHGIYGRGGNWRRVARSLMKEKPELGVVLVDLRMHGQSQDFAGPHTVDACAHDVAELISTLEREGKDVAGVLGHSFGGKVALALRSLQLPVVLPLWIIDSSPAIREGQMDPEKANTVVKVLRMLEALPARFESRAQFTELVTAQDFPLMLAQWLGMNLVAEGDSYRFGLDLSAMEELLRDYFARNLWPVVESPSAPIYFAIASRGSALSAGDQARLRELEGPMVQTRVLDGGHWLHVEALEPLVAYLSESLDRGL